MNANADLLRQRGLLAAVLGAGVFIGAAGLYIYKEFVQERRRCKIAQRLEILDLSVTEIQQELLQLRSGGVSFLKRKQSNGSVQSLRRRRRHSGYETESDLYSAVETDDDEFYDFDEDELMRDLTQDGDGCNHLSLFLEVDGLLTSDDLDKEKAFRILQEMEPNLGESCEFLWRLAKAYHSKAAVAGSEDEKKSLIFQGLEKAEKALSCDVGSPDAHKWYAILLGLKGSYVSTKEKIENGFLFQKHVVEALKLRPDDASLHHLLGRFKFEIANLSWVEKKMASTLFAELPSATLSDAAADFEKAEELNPVPWLENRLLLAKCCLADKEYERGILWLKKGQDIDAVSSVDLACKQEVESLLLKYNKHS